MSFSDYHFITHWRIQGSKEIIYQILKDGAGYERWWKPAYVTSTEVGKNKIRSLVRAKLPYTLTFTTEAVREIPYEEFEIRSSGELAGTGLWKFRQVNEWTEIDFYWDVRAEKPLVRWLSLFLKPIFRWNHDWVMKTGETCLQEEVRRRT